MRNKLHYLQNLHWLTLVPVCLHDCIWNEGACIKFCFTHSFTLKWNRLHINAINTHFSCYFISTNASVKNKINVKCIQNINDNGVVDETWLISGQNKRNNCTNRFDHLSATRCFFSQNINEGNITVGVHL